MAADTGEEALVEIHPTAWSAPGVQIYGRVTIAEEVSIWPNAVIRAECHDVHIGRYTNVQDFVMVHVGYDAGTRVGAFCSIAHHATIHGCTIEDECLIGINACIMDGAVIGRGSIVAGNAMVREDSIFPPGSVIAGVPAKQIAERDNARANRLNAWLYHLNKQGYERGDHRVWVGDEYRAWLAEKKKLIEEDRDLLDL